MLAEILTEQRAYVLWRAAMRIPGAEDCLAKLLTALVFTLRRGRLEPARFDALDGGTVETDALLEQIHALESCIYDLIEERALVVPPHDLRLLSGWLRSRTEAVLRRVTSQLEALADAVPDRLALQDPVGRLLYVNRAGMAMVGPDYRGRLLRELGVDETLARAADAGVSRAVAGETVTAEVRIREPDGGWRWLESKVSPVFAADGGVVAVAVSSRDIDARKAAEARLQLLAKVSELAATTEYEAILGGVARLSIPELADWCVVDVFEGGGLRRARVAHADPARDALAHELEQLPVPTGDTPKHRRLLEGGSVLIPEITDAWRQAPAFAELIRRLDARSLLIVPFRAERELVAIATFVMTSESGRRYGLEDVTLAEEMARRTAHLVEKARLTSELERSASRFRVALATQRIAVFEQDRELRYRWYYNPAVAPLDFRGKTHADVLPPDEAVMLSAIKQRVIDTGEPMRGDIYLTTGGERRYVREAIDPVRDDTGAIIGVIGAAADITDEKRAQDQLADMVSFRERLMGVLGHDLRNPLGAILMFAYVALQETGMPDLVRQNLKRIESAAGRMRELIETLLDVTRVRAGGGVPITREPVDLRELVGRIVDELRAADPGRELRVHTRGDLHGQWDPARLAQLVSNLVGNAFAHGARDQPIDVELDGEGPQVALRVTNGGPAIPAELVPRLFNAFEQGPDVHAVGSSRGLGLGLFIARQVVLAHKGAIDVRSSDQATTFAVHLPRE